MELVARLQSLATGRGRKALVVTASLVLVLLIGYTLAAFVWLAVEGVPVAAMPPAAPAAAVAPPREFTPEMARGWALFGDAATGSATGERAVPETNLALQLLGIFSTGDDRLAGAVIAERGKDGELFRIGASLPGGALLEKVGKDHVLLKRRGQMETLRFDEASSGMSADTSTGLDIAGGFRNLKDRMSKQAPAAVPAGDPDAADRSRSALGQYAEDMKSNPDAVLSDLGLKPANGGGYTVGDGASADLVRNLGLRPGDVVISVNGKPLGNVQNDARMIDEVKASGEARVEIKRGSQTFTVNYPL
ncbi:MAG: type II secretion system protein N [Pseudomonadota bacterium]